MRKDSMGLTSANTRGDQECNLTYVLITPAKNEAAFIEQTIKSVVNQTIPPLKWVIVSDGSTDGTDDIVKKYATEYQWIELVRMPERTERHFAGKVHAFNGGYERVKDLKYDIIGSLDADISFEEDYFSFLLNKFAENPQLGVGGTPFREGTVQYDYRFSRKEHVSGACQLFKQECFESIEGYVPLKAGAIDLTAVVTARMKGWKTETFTDKICIHHRKMGTAKAHISIASFKSGYGDYPMGVHPVWQLFRSIYQMSRKPIILGGMMLMAGYMWAMLTRAQKPVSIEFVQFRRKEQMQWLNEYFRKVLCLFRYPNH
jgi:glycosyltransferase involved in cell wall biosynthesis